MAAPTLIDLFAGCGGMTVGFTSAGFEPVAAVEYNEHAAATYAANFGEEHLHLLDIAEWTEVPRADVVIGGPPCQGFSNLGTRDADDPRNRLWQQYARVVATARPKAFVIENVDRYHRSPEFDLLLAEVHEGQLRGYELVHEVVNAADYGVPQRRRRTIVIGSRVGKPQLPTATHAENGAGGLQPWTTVRDAIAGIPYTPDKNDLPETTTPFFGLHVPGVFKGLDLHLGRNPKQISLLRYDCIPPGGGRFDLPDELMPNCWRKKPVGTTDVMGRMQWNRPSLTIRTEFFKPEKGQYLHPQWDPDDPSKRVNRPITHLEAAALQTFPSDYMWCGTKIEIARQIGNAVPCTLAKAIAESVRDQFDL